MYVNCRSVKLATSVQSVFTIGKLAALSIIIISGLVLLAQGQLFQSIVSVFSDDMLSWLNIYFAYFGKSNMSFGKCCKSTVALVDECKIMSNIHVKEVFMIVFVWLCHRKKVKKKIPRTNRKETKKAPNDLFYPQIKRKKNGGIDCPFNSHLAIKFLSHAILNERCVHNVP